MSRSGRFQTPADLLRAQIRTAGEARGFAVTRLLTHWAEIVGEDTARLARPKDIRYGRGQGRPGAAEAQGAILVVEVAGPAALRIEMERERIRERVNAVYGYAAIRAIRIRQVGPQGFSEPAAALRPSSAPDVASVVEPLTAGVADTELRLALAALAANVLSKARS